MTLFLFGVVILACVAGMLWLLFVFLAETWGIAQGFWKSREGMNPFCAAGRWRLAGLALLGAGVLLTGEWVGIRTVSTLLEWVGWMAADSRPGMLGRFVLLLLGIGVAWLGFSCLGRAKRHEAGSAEEALAQDRRPPVLYLRSFGDDARVARRIGVAGFKLSTEETELAEVFRPLGPLVAIGRPGEAIGWAGAARKYVSNEDWQECVRDLMQQARLVILRAGTTQGLWWEIAESARSVRPERLVFLIPLRQPEYGEFRAKAEEYLPCRLPDYQGCRNPVVTFRSVLYFDADWTPHLYPIAETTAQYMLRALGDSLSGETSWRAKQSKGRVVLDRTFEPILARAAAERTTVASRPGAKRSAPPGAQKSVEARSKKAALPGPKRDAQGRFLKNG